MTKDGRRKIRESWTPERRQRASDAMRARQAKARENGGHIGRQSVDLSLDLRPPTNLPLPPRLLRPDGKLLALRLVAPGIYIIRK